MADTADHIARAEVSIAASPSRVWAVLTEPAQVAKWMLGTTVETDWKVGSRIIWSGEYGGASFEDKGEVLEIEREHRLKVTHYSPMSGAEDKPENYHVVDYQLAADGAVTRLMLEQSGNDSAEQAEQFSANWQQMLEAAKGVAESESDA